MATVAAPQAVAVLEDEDEAPVQFDHVTTIMRTGSFGSATS
jgi:hypothetical protein